MQRSTARRVAPALALTVMAWGCDEGDPVGPDDQEQSSLSVLITDAPGAVEAVWVEILNITLHGGEEGPATLLDESTGLIEITELVGTSQTLVSDLALDPASYGQLRLVLGSAILLSEEGGVYVMGNPEPWPEYEGEPLGEATGELHCPSCAQSGLKVKIPGDEVVLAEGAASMVLDFDVAQSFGHKAGSSGRWVMTPTIHGTLVGGGGSTAEPTGSIEGTVVLGTDVTIPACPEGTPRGLVDFIPEATGAIPDGDGSPITRTGVVAEAGTFSIGPLAADTYTLGHQTQLDFTGASLQFGATVEPATADVTDGPIGGVVYTITSAGCVVS